MLLRCVVVVAVASVNKRSTVAVQRPYGIHTNKVIFLVDCQMPPAVCVQLVVRTPAVRHHGDFLWTWRSMISNNVGASLLLLGQIVRKISFVSRQILPITHCPSTNLLLLYFCFPNLLSSTLTVNPSPLINVGVSRDITSRQTSRQ